MKKSQMLSSYFDGVSSDQKRKKRKKQVLVAELLEQLKIKGMHFLKKN